MKAAFGNSAAEHTRRRITRSHRRVAVLRRRRNGPGSRFDRETGGISRIESWPAKMPISPAARKIVDGDIFEADGVLYQVEDMFPSTAGAQADVLIIRGSGWMRRDVRFARRALQVRDIEQMIAEERIDFPFASSAKQFNLSHGWGRGGRTLASLGIAPGGDE